MSKSPTDTPWRPPRIVVGRVGRPHGLDGSFFVEDASDDPARFATGQTLHVGDRPELVLA